MKMQSVPPPDSHRSSFDRDGRLFIGAAFWPLCPRVQHRPMHRRPAALARSSRSGRPAQRGIFTQSPDERLPLSRGAELLTGGDTGIRAKQALTCTCGKITKESCDRFFTALAESGATDQADPDTANQHDAGQGGDDVGAYGSPRPLAVAFAQQRARFARAQTRDRRRVDGLNGALLTAQADWFDRQVGQAPSGGPIKQRIKPERAARHGPFNAMPAPAQVRDIRQRGAGKASLAVDELAGEQGDEHNTDEPELHGRNALGRYRMK
jgi:hypothetical protein